MSGGPQSPAAAPGSGPVRGARFPRALRIDLAYDSQEDRIRADLALRIGPRRVWLTRRVVLGLVVRLRDAVQSSAPWRGRVPGVAVPETERLERAVAVSTAERTGAISRGARRDDVTAAVDCFLASRVLVEDEAPRLDATDSEASFRIGFVGVAAGGQGDEVPVAALGVTRTQAHQVLAVFEEKMAMAGWVTTSSAPTAPDRRVSH